MALINCPHCGGSISDSAVKCVHCGCDLSAKIKKEQIEKEYSVLPIEEKKRIRKEYDKINPAYRKSEKNEDKFLFTMGGFLVAALATLILLAVYGGIAIKNTGTPISVENIIFIVLLIVFVIIIVILKFFWRESEKQRIYEQKKFAVWLEKEKGLTYNIVLTEEDRKEFNSFKAD